MLYAFNDAKAAERHETQYFEMFCNRGIYHKGWTAVTRHGVPWLGAYKRGFDEDVWELYDTNTDWTQAHDLAKENPKKLAELQRLFLIEAGKYSVLPLDDRTFERFNPDLAGRPQLIKGNTQLLFGGMGRLSENSIVSIKNKSYAITADVDVPKSGAEGVIIAQGGSTNGWSLYAKGGKLKYCYNFFGIDITVRRGDAGRFPPATTRCGWSSSTTAAASPRAAPSRSTSTASRWARAASSGRCRWPSPPTRPAMSARRPGRRCRRTTGRRATPSAAR